VAVVLHVCAGGQWIHRQRAVEFPKGSVSFTKTCKGRDRCLTDLQRSPTELHVVGTSYNTETSVLHSTAPSEYLR
jgi:hypothetical protein